MVKRDRKKPEKLAAPPPRARKPIDRRHALIGVVILIALFTYGNSFRAPFLMDNSEIQSDTRIREATFANVKRIFTGSYHQASLTGLYRPFTSLTYLYNYSVRGDGANAEGYHRFNFALHAVNILLVYALGLVLFESIPPALALAALWGVHPVLTEGVTNLVGRADMLAAFGALAAVVAYHHSLRTTGLARPGLIAIVAAATLVGSFSKESGVVALAAVMLYDVLFARERAWSARIPGYVAAALPVAAFLTARAKVLAGVPIAPTPFLDNPIVGAGFVEGRMTALKVIGKYLGLMFWPVNLSQDYSYNEIAVRVDAGGVIGLVICLGALGLAVWSWRTRRALAFSILFFFAAIAPVANVFLLIGSIMGERFVYLPAVGVVAAVVYGLDRLWQSAPQHRTAIAAGLGVALLVLAGRAHARNEDWTDERRFWESAVSAAPGSFKAALSRAAVLPRNSPAAWEHAISETQRAIAIIEHVPDEITSAFPYRNAGILYRAYGESIEPRDPAGAARWYRQSLNALSRSETIERKQDAIIQQLNARRGLKAETYLPVAVYRELGQTYLKLRDMGSAVQTLELGRKLESDPDLLEALSAAYRGAGDPRKSVQALVEALAMDGKRTYVVERMLGLYREIDPAGCAVQADGSLNLACPMVRDDLCGASKNVAQNYLRRGQTAEAASIRRVAMQDLGCPASALD